MAHACYVCLFHTAVSECTQWARQYLHSTGVCACVYVCYGVLHFYILMAHKQRKISGNTKFLLSCYSGLSPSSLFTFGLDDEGSLSLSPVSIFRLSTLFCFPSKPVHTLGFIKCHLSKCVRVTNKYSVLKKHSCPVY